MPLVVAVVLVAGLSAATAEAADPSLRRACRGRDGWSDPAPPVQVFGDVYYVGTCGITVLLVTSPDGHVLIDTSTEEAAPQVLANLRALGFDPRDVRVLVGSHEHHDHQGGFAALQAATGAVIALRAPAAAVIESGQPDPQDPQIGLLPTMTPAPVARVLEDGDVVRVGDIALTAVATPGHSSGSTSWTWRSCEGERCVSFVYADSLTAVSGDDYRFSEHPDRVARFHETFDRIEDLDCDVLVTPHPSFSDLFDRLGGKAPLVDPGACRRLVGAMRDRLERRIAEEGS